MNVNIAPLYACEWILDRVRTAVNVYSHCVCTIMTNKLLENDATFKKKDGETVKFSNGCVSTDNCVNKNFEKLEADKLIEKL